MEELTQKVLEIRKDFPLLAGSDIAYLDNAATTQKPLQVLAAEREYYEKENANPFRGVYDLSEAATERYEHARARVAQFIHAEEPEEIIFTRNASESLNLVAFCYGLSHLKPGDELVVSVMEHHSNFLPWKMVAERTGATLKKLSCDQDGAITEAHLEEALSAHTKLVALTQTSNVFGRVNDIAGIAKRVHALGAVLVVDGAQSVPHMPVDVTALDADFLVFSGHKMLAPMGIGVLYGKRALLEDMPPFLQGGEMIETVHWDSVRYAPIPHKFEAGTVNAGGAAALAAAIDYIEGIGFDFIHEQEQRLTRLAMEEMKKLPGIRIIGSDDPAQHMGIVTFIVEGVHPHDVASIFNAEGICVRAGHHCAQPLMDHLGVFSTTRVSFYFYNTEDEVRRFVEVLGGIRRQMGYGE
jgi:cysteine desulfurase/selenocysteine lyase